MGRENKDMLGKKNAKFHLRAHFLTSCSSKMPSLFLVCFGTTVFVCLLFSTQFDFEAKATGKYKHTNKEKHAMWGLSPIKPLFGGCCCLFGIPGWFWQQSQCFRWWVDMKEDITPTQAS